MFSRDLKLLKQWFVSCVLIGLASGAQAAPEPVRMAMIEGLSGSFANAGEAVHRNLLLAVERVDARGGVQLPGGAQPLELLRFDSKGNDEETLAMLKAALDRQVSVVMQGNSSSAAAVLIDALNKHNEREPGRRVLFLNYSAVDPALTNEKCSFWHFRFDAHADMRLAALTDVLRDDAEVKKVYLIGQDYSFGQQVLREARSSIALKRPDIEIVGDELHSLGRVKDFLPYAAKIKASGAHAVLTGNWGNDLTLLIKAEREVGVDARFYTFYGNALGAPAAIGDAGVGRVLAVAEWHPNVGTPASERFYASFRERFPKPQDDYVHARMQVMIEMLVTAMERAQHRGDRDREGARRHDAGSAHARRCAPGLDARRRSPVHPAALRERDGSRWQHGRGARQRRVGLRLQNDSLCRAAPDRAAAPLQNGAPIEGEPVKVRP